MGYRREPEATEEHVAYIYELLRRLRFHNHPIVPFDHTHPPDCPCPVNVRHCTVSSPYDEYSGQFTDGPFTVRYEFADFDDYDQWILGNSPEAYWRMDETSGTTLSDSSGNGHHLTTSGGPTLNQTGPLSGMKAVTFDGIDDKARDPSTGVQSGVTRFMSVCWLKTTNPGDAGGEVIWTTRDGGDGMSLGYGPDWGAFGTLSGDGSLTYADDGVNSLGGRFTTERIDDGNWHIVHAIWTGQPAGYSCGNPPDPECFDTWSIYIDGALGTMNDINEGVNTNFHNPPLTGMNFNIAHAPAWGAYAAFTIAGLAVFPEETTVAPSSECQLYPEDDVLFVDGTGGTLPIPAAADSPNKHQWVKNIATGDLILDPAGSDIIEEGLTYTLAPLDSAHLFSDGVEWFLL